MTRSASGEAGTRRSSATHASSHGVGDALRQTEAALLPFRRPTNLGNQSLDQKDGCVHWQPTRVMEEDIGVASADPLASRQAPCTGQTTRPRSWRHEHRSNQCLCEIDALVYEAFPRQIESSLHSLWDLHFTFRISHKLCFFAFFLVVGANALILESLRYKALP